MSHTYTDRQGRDPQIPKTMPGPQMGQAPMAYPQQQYPMPMMVPMYMPNMGYYGQPVMMGNPFGQSPYNIPQLDNQGVPVQSMPEAQSSDRYQSWQPSPKRIQPKTKEEFIERFNKEVLPRLGMSRLIRLQAAIRGWYSRRIIIPRKLMWFAILEDYTAKKIDEFLQDSIVPDVVMEVINENAIRKDYDLYSTKFRGEIKYIDQMVERVVAKMAKEAVQESISGITHDYLRKKQEEKITTTDPLELLWHSFLDGFVRKESADVAHDAVAEMTDLYIVESQFITFYRRKLMKERIDQVMKEAIDELLCEHFVNKTIEKILEELAEPLALLCAEEEFFEKESEEIEKGFDDLVHRNIMELVLEGMNERLADKNLEYIADQATLYNKYKDFSEEFLNEILMFDDK